MRFLTSPDVRKLVKMGDVIESVEEAYRKLGNGRATDIPRENISTEGLSGSMKSLSGAVDGIGSGGFYYTGGFPGGASQPTMLTLVFGEEDGRILAVVESDRLSWMRTGATSGVATDYCARPDATQLGIIGSGKYAESQVLGVTASRDIDVVRVFSPTPEHRQQFAERVAPHIDASIHPVSSPADAISEADVVCTATTSSEPVFDGKDLSDGTHINAIGSHYPNHREVDSETVERSRVIADTLHRARKEEGELQIPVEEGRLDWDDVLELGSVVTGDATPRQQRDQITLFTSGGVAVEYVVPARHLYDKAVTQDRGIEVDATLESSLL